MPGAHSNILDDWSSQRLSFARYRLAYIGLEGLGCINCRTVHLQIDVLKQTKPVWAALCHDRLSDPIQTQHLAHIEWQL